MSKPKSDDHRGLRFITLLSIIPTIPLAAAHAGVTASISVVIGLIPMTCSAVLAFFILRYKSNKDDDSVPGLLIAPNRHSKAARNVLALMDAFLAALHLTILIFIWIEMSHVYNPEMAIVGSYASVPMISNFLIHTYLATHRIFRRLLQKKCQGVTCPNCHMKISRRTQTQVPRMSIAPYEDESSPLIGSNKNDDDDEDEDLRGSRANLV